MQRPISYIFCTFLAGLVVATEPALGAYANKFCSDPRFECIRVQPGQSWQSLWPDVRERDVVKRLNRVNIPLYPGMIVAVPKGLSYLSALDVSPFHPYIDPPGVKTIIIDQKRLAWAAYDASGELVHWGPISSGQDWCDDIQRDCKTSSGKFYVYTKQGATCKSTKYPIGEGGAPMPYCMFFNGGVALHGSTAVPGYRASHGCVRIFNEDAEWLNRNFVTLPGSESGKTRVIVEPI